MWYENYDLEHVKTLVDFRALEYLLQVSSFGTEQTKFLVDGFRDGFDLGYRGSFTIKRESPNLKLTVGSLTDLWNKVMKEVQLGRYAGPYATIPYKYYIQSPIGLVPKDNGTKTRLIFHLSYPRGEPDPKLSVNANTPDDLSKVEYKDFKQAVIMCIRAGPGCAAAKSDLSSAFRHLCLAKKYWCLLVMKAKHPLMNTWFYFIDKCMPFGASISCANFQKFSDALAHIVKHFTGFANLNYLDDFFFVAVITAICNKQVSMFMKICHLVRFPVSQEKTVWACTKITFLGLLIDTVAQLVCIPVEKVDKAKFLINSCINKPSRKIKLSGLQELCGFLNFLCKAVVPGRAFTRRIYAHGAKLTKPNHHLKVTKEIKADLNTWLCFIDSPQIYCRPFFDFDNTVKSEYVDLATDASANPLLGAGGCCRNNWFMLQWDQKFMRKNNPSINFLELYAATIGILNWIHLFQNRRVTMFCDNTSVMHMLNNSTSGCKYCMVLIRIIVLECLTNNVKLKCCYVPSEQNVFPDLLSRLKYDQFRKESRKKNVYFKGTMTPIPDRLWPMEKVWWSKHYY